MVAASTLVGLWIAPRWGTAPVDMIYLPAVLAAAALWGLGPGAGRRRCRRTRLQFLLHRAGPHLPHRPPDRHRHRHRSAARRAGHQHARRRHPRAGAARRRPRGTQCDHRRFCAAAAVVQQRAGHRRDACAELRRLFDCNAMLVERAAAPACRGRRAERQPADAERHRRGGADDRVGRSRAGRGHGADSAGRMGVPSGRLGTGGPRRGGACARRRHAAGRARTSCRCSTTCSTSSRLRSSARGSKREAREFAAVRERDRLRSALLASIGQDVRPRLTAIGAAVRELRRSGLGRQAAASRPSDRRRRKLDRYIDNLLDLGPAARPAADRGRRRHHRPVPPHRVARTARTST